MAAEEWVEVRGPSVEIAVEGALAELGLASADDADIEVIEEGQRGFLGMGGQDALVRVKAKDKQSSGRGRGRGSRSSNDRRSSSSARSDSSGNGAKRSSGGERKESSSRGRESGSRDDSRKRPEGGSRRSRPADKPDRPKREDDDREEMTAEAQADELKGFLSGLLESFGLEGEVVSRVEDGVVYVEVLGEQTEALVGPKGSLVQATLELCRTIIQRKTQSGAKIRLDIAGYAERRREALRIYTARLAEKIVAEGGEIMLEPMNAADRKVVHDAVGEIDGVRSFSEGEEPRRSVVIAKE